VFEPVNQAFLDACDAILVTSKDLIENTPCLRPHMDRCYVVPYGVDPQRFEDPRHAQIASIHKKYGKRFALFVGRLAYYKGLDVLIESMKQVDFPLVIVGSGEVEADARRQVAEAGLESRIHFAGSLYDKSLIDMYHACEMFVLPSTSSAEAFGLVQVEAMMAGKPVINTFLETGVPTVSVHNETGITVPPSDHHALAEAMNCLFKDDATRQQLGSQAKLRALELYTAERYNNNVWSIYQSLLADGVQQEAIKAVDARTRKTHSVMAGH
jgi:rhamnosyl/mannosyltransferase